MVFDREVRSKEVLVQSSFFPLARILSPLESSAGKVCLVVRVSHSFLRYVL